MTLIDPLDHGHPGVKEWEEFRSSYAAAFLFVWLMQEMRDTLENYAQELHDRFMSGWDIQEGLEIDADLPDDARGFPLPPIGGVAQEGYENDLTWMDNSEARALYHQLFPHSGSQRDFAAVGMLMAVVALHAALEAYVRAVGVDVRGPLPRSIERFLQGQGAQHLIDSVTMRSLVDCDATRHLAVHDRGIVDDRYLRSVPYPAFERGEFRRLAGRELQAFARAIWKAAAAVRAALPQALT